jgi:CheY-like chemotaxis protein
MEKIRKTRYDLIFLDDLMPIMAGVETLEKMKKEMPHAIRDIPIIVLTANAISGAREAYLSEGFWDYLSKPIEGKVLERMCMKWLPKEKVIKVSGKGAAPAEKESAEPLIDEKLGLSYCMDNMDFYKEMIQSFLDTGHMEKLKKFFAAEDWKNYQIAVHGLKSSSLALGARKLSDLAKQCELSLKNGEGPGFVKEHQEELSKLYEETEAELRKILK